MQHYYSSVSEPIADLKWQKLFRERWPYYKAWLNSCKHRTDSDLAIAMLREYMPELSGTHEHLCTLVSADQLARGFLTGFQPPAYSHACSQAVTKLDMIQLARNYDYYPKRFEGVLLKTAWNGKKVIANSDCLIGVLDGMNEDGLAISLTFGGSEVVGFGFGIPFILRYILEFCSNAYDAVEVLIRVPSHMAYNVTVADKNGIIRTVEITPNNTPTITEEAFATNHQGEWSLAEEMDLNQTAQRSNLIKSMLTKGVKGAALTNNFLKPPLYNSISSEGIGTLYTAVYRPVEGMVQIHWPNDSMFQSFDYFREEKKLIKYADSNSFEKQDDKRKLNTIY